MYNIIYKNNFREQVCITEWPYMVTGGNIFDGEWEEIENDDRIQDWEKTIQKRKLSIDIGAAGLKTFQEAVDFLDSVFEKDLVAGQPGRLYVGDTYMSCFIYESEKDRWINDLQSITCDLAIMSDYPYWIKEVPFRYRKRRDASDALGLDYEYEYEFEYAGDESIQYLENMHYTDSGFRMVIYGPCINPAIRIAGHLYEIRATLYEGEYAVIDCSTRYAQDRAIYRVQNGGEQMDLFNARNKDSEVWKKIPPGKNSVTWNGEFPFDITLFNEKGVPLWNS